MDCTLPGLGIDVSAATLDVKLSSDKSKRSQFKRVANALEGLEQVQQWLELQGLSQVHVCMEATGTYSDLAALFFFERGHQVSVVNPARVKAFRRSEGMVSKTDRQDALLLARFVEQKRPALWKPTPQVLQQAQVLLARIDDVTQMARQEKNRLSNPRLDEQTRTDIQEHLKWLEDKRKGYESRVVQLLKDQPPEGAEVIQEQADATPETREQAPAGALTAEQMWKGCQLIDSLPGVGQLTALRLYSVYWDQERFPHVGSVVNYAGISSAHRESGTSVRGEANISRTGNANVRRWLYMCAVVATTHNPDFRRWKQELEARGKKGLVIIVAVMRKLLHLMHGVLKSGQPYDARKAWPSHYKEEGEEQQAA
ncbi:MAG: IS110 family transposase [Ktedonobacteraceae bacterium]